VPLHGVILALGASYHEHRHGVQVCAIVCNMPPTSRRNIPAASSWDARQRMKMQKRANTSPEVVLRRELYGRGLRYRVHRQPLAGLRRTVDVVFPGSRVAVEVMGCFWHSCPSHGTAPRANAAWWADKLARNSERDAEAAAALEEAGWLLIIVWEHESVTEAADGIECAVRSRSARTIKSTVSRN
jgi:DNA mismatch endonuclease (patch repair protein)